jgi:uncharacterized Zn finger protein (UPF0148 family)
MITSMERCPTCKAPYKGKPVCPRCGTDLGILIQIENDAARDAQQASEAFDSGYYERAFACARRSLSLRQSPAARKILAAAALLTGRYKMGMQLQYPSVRRETPE